MRFNEVIVCLFRNELNAKRGHFMNEDGHVHDEV